MSFGSPYLTLPDFVYHKPSSVAEVTGLLREYGDQAAVMAGGVGLVAFMKERLLSPAHVIDIKGVRELRQISYASGKGLSVGAAVTIEEVGRDDMVKERYPALHEAASKTADPIIRGRATLVGNLCEAIPWVDSPPVLMALDATIEIATPSGRRSSPVAGFIKGPVEIDLAPDEFVTRILVPDPGPGCRSAFEKFIAGSEFSLASVAVAITPGNKKRAARVVFGSVNSTACRCEEAEKALEEGALDLPAVRRAATIASERVECADDVLAGAAYRRQLVKVITVRALERVLRS